LRGITALHGFKVGAKGVGAGEIEINPKQDLINEGGYGNLVALPLAGKSVPLDTTWSLLT
jgi:hypothetical protein